MRLLLEEAFKPYFYQILPSHAAQAAEDELFQNFKEENLVDGSVYLKRLHEILAWFNQDSPTFQEELQDFVMTGKI